MYISRVTTSSSETKTETRGKQQCKCKDNVMKQTNMLCNEACQFMQHNKVWRYCPATNVEDKKNLKMCAKNEPTVNDLKRIIAAENKICSNFARSSHSILIIHLHHIWR